MVRTLGTDGAVKRAPLDVELIEGGREVFVGVVSAKDDTLLATEVTFKIGTKDVTEVLFLVKVRLLVLERRVVSEKLEGLVGITLVVVMGTEMFMVEFKVRMVGVRVKFEEDVIFVGVVTMDGVGDGVIKVVGELVVEFRVDVELAEDVVTLPAVTAIVVAEVVVVFVAVVVVVVVAVVVVVVAVVGLRGPVPASTLTVTWRRGQVSDVIPMAWFCHGHDSVSLMQVYTPSSLNARLAMTRVQSPLLCS